MGARVFVWMACWLPGYMVPTGSPISSDFIRFHSLCLLRPVGPQNRKAAFDTAFKRSAAAMNKKHEDSVRLQQKAMQKEVVRLLQEAASMEVRCLPCLSPATSSDVIRLHIILP